MTLCLPAGEAGQGGAAGGGAAPAAGQPAAAGGVADGRGPAAHLHGVVLQHRGQEVLASPSPRTPGGLQSRVSQARGFSRTFTSREVSAVRSVWHRAPGRRGPHAFSAATVSAGTPA